MLGSKDLLPPTDANEKFRFELLRSKLLPQFCKHSESVDLLHKSLLPHVWRVPSSKALSCKHERLFDLLTLISFYINFSLFASKKHGIILDITQTLHSILVGKKVNT